MKNASSGSPFSGQPRLNTFWIWLSWLTSLGGSWPIVWEEPSTDRRGRRDPDRKPRTYPLDDKKYGMDPKTGTIWRRPQ